VGQRHELPMPVVMTATGTMGEESAGDSRRDRRAVPASLRGLDRFEARDRDRGDAAAHGRLVKVEPHQHAVRQCYRCDTVVEPRLSDQWFVKMKPLAEPALAACAMAHPHRARALGGVYINWLERSATGTSRASSGGAIAFPCGTAMRCGRVTVSRDDVANCPSCADRCGRTRTCSTRGSRRGSGRSRRSAGRRTRRPARSIRRTCS
jgi:valyl-tRNA synthetase